MNKINHYYKMHSCLLYKQAAFTMTTALIFLFALLLIGMGGIRSGVMQERMVGNSKDVNLAFQAAEAGLREAENDISINFSASTSFTNTCTNGLCIPATMQSPITTIPVWDSVDWTSAAATRLYGQYTAVAALPSVAMQPRYIVEKLPWIGAAAGESIGMGIQAVSTGQAYRITVYATGARAETHITLQSIYSKR
jgi:type IV pilus assembly protein PilX